MGLRGRDIVCLSTHFWDERRFRKQEFMERFARANRILYVEPSFSMARRPEEHLRDVATNRFGRPRLEARSDSLFLLKPPRGFPKWTDPRIAKATYRWYGRIVGRAARRLGFSDTIVWVYRPNYYHALESIPHEQLVFDLVDDLAAYDGGDTAYSAYVEECVTGLARSSDLVVATARTLVDRYRLLAKQLEHVPNGFDATLFSSEAAVGDRPAPLRSIPRPILGFIGTLFGFIDFELLEQVAKIHSDKSVVLVGPIETSARDAVRRLTSLPNIFHIPGQPQALIPSYVASFDVCLNPFRRGRVSDSVNPLKVYEYLAMGRPVVSTSMESLRLEEVGELVEFADDAAEFCRAIDHCLGPAARTEERARRERVAPYSWHRLFERLDALCEQALARAS